ncbi:MAG: Uncharacterized protein FD126_3606, partial [Elusimicrobia bacterium]
MKSGRDRLIYDGDCAFCRASVKWLSRFDPTGRIELLDFRKTPPKTLDPRLSAEACETRIHLVESSGRLSGGFEAFKRLCVRLPLLWPAAPL